MHMRLTRLSHVVIFSWYWHFWMTLVARKFLDFAELNHNNEFSHIPYSLMTFTIGIQQ